MGFWAQLAVPLQIVVMLFLWVVCKNKNAGDQRIEVCLTPIIRVLETSLLREVVSWDRSLLSIY